MKRTDLTPDDVNRAGRADRFRPLLMTKAKGESISTFQFRIKPGVTCWTAQTYPGKRKP